MEKRATNGYIFIGTAARYLMDVKPGWPIFGTGGIAANIRMLDEYLKWYEFHVTSRLFSRIADMLSDWEREVGLPVGSQTPNDLVSPDELGSDLAGEPPPPPQEKDIQRDLTPEEAAKMVDAAALVREALLAEAQGTVNYVASDKRYTVRKLTEEFGTLMARGVYESLPEIAQRDLEEAGKCIAYELPTSAAFHLMRGTEAVLRYYYECKVRRNRISEPRMWAQITGHLKDKKTPPGLIESLDNIRKNYRNPTQHPDKIYDLDESQDLLALSLDVTNRMMRDLSAK